MQESWRDLSKPTGIEVEEETLTPTYGRFFGEPFERGFGTTLGNAIRRVLLSSLSGAAITKVRIKNVLHEFSTVPGVTEDVTDILLNLKEVRFRLRDSETETARLDVRSAGEVTAAALIVGSRAEILNPGTHLASLGKDAHLELEAIISRGRGYVTAERHKSEEIGEWLPEVGEVPSATVNENLLRPIEELNLSVRSANCLQSADLRYVGELVQKTEADLLRTKNFGRKSLNEIKETLHNMGLELGMQLENFPSREELERRRIAEERDLS